MSEITLDVRNLITFTDAAEELGVTRTTIYNFVERYRLHPVSIGRNRYILRSELDQLLAEKEKNDQINKEAAGDRAAS